MITLQAALSGVVVGGMYGLMALGIVVIYKATRVLNLAQAAIGSLAAYCFFELAGAGPFPYWPAVFLCVGAAGLAGFGLDWVFRPVYGKDLTTGAILSVGLMVTILPFITLVWGDTGGLVPAPASREAFRMGGDLFLTWAQLVLLVITAVLAGGLAVFFNRTALGRAIRAISEDRQAVATLGINPSLISGSAWAIGTALAALAGILISPLLSLEVASLSFLLMKALVAALIGRFVSLPGAFLGGVALGVLENVLAVHWQVAGVRETLMLVLVIALLTLRSERVELAG
jgi:branched-subunit amino acid ABC-type transport system permease component